MLVVPGADEQDVAHDDPAGLRAPRRLEDLRARAGSAGRRGPCGPAGARRKPPASRSSIAPKTRGPSMRGRHIHSMLPLGATSAHGLAVRQERVVRDRRERRLPPSRGRRRRSASCGPAPSRPLRAARGVGRVAQQRLADALAEDPGLAARGAEDRPVALGRRRAALLRARAARRCRGRGRAPRPMRVPASARPGRARCIWASRSSTSLTSSRRGARAAAQRVAVAGRSARPASSPGARPASRGSSRRRDRRVAGGGGR